MRARSTLYNPDLAPVPVGRRSWGTYQYAALWIGMSVQIPTYMLASGLIAGGMSAGQAIMTILLGNLIVLAPLLLNAHAGARYGIPFPVLVRASFGVYGANLPAILRAIVACGWFGIQTWIGGQAIDTMLRVAWPGWTNVPGGQWIGFLLFWTLNMVVVYRGIETVRFLQGLGAPLVAAVAALLLWWVVSQAGGFGPVVHARSRFTAASEFWNFFVPSVTGIVGFWATVALNIPDFTRYARSNRAQILGQALALPTAMTLFSLVGIAVTSACVVIFGEAIWDPVALIGRFNQPAVACVALVCLALATLNANIAANVVSPSNDFSNLSPRWISFRTGGLITGAVGLVIMPGRLLTDYRTYIFTWLVGYSALLGPIAGIMIADYFLIRRRVLRVDDLYRRGGEYEYRHGVNPRAILAFAIGVTGPVLGFFVDSLRSLYDYAWFVGLAVAGTTYWASMRTATKASRRIADVGPN